jgi:hypothetical protein
MKKVLEHDTILEVRVFQESDYIGSELDGFLFGAQEDSMAFQELPWYLLHLVGVGCRASTSHSGHPRQFLKTHSWKRAMPAYDESLE